MQVKGQVPAIVNDATAVIEASQKEIMDKIDSDPVVKSLSKEIDLLANKLTYTRIAGKVSVLAAVIIPFITFLVTGHWVFATIEGVTITFSYATLVYQDYILDKGKEKTDVYTVVKTDLLQRNMQDMFNKTVNNPNKSMVN